MDLLDVFNNRKVKELECRLEAILKEKKHLAKQLQKMVLDSDFEKEKIEYQNQELIIARESLNYDQKRFLEKKASYEAHLRVIRAKLLAYQKYLDNKKRELSSEQSEWMSQLDNFQEQKQKWQGIINNLVRKYADEKQKWEQKILFLEQKYESKQLYWANEERRWTKVFENLLVNAQRTEHKLNELHQSVLEQESYLNQLNDDIKIIQVKLVDEEKSYSELNTRKIGLLSDLDQLQIEQQKLDQEQFECMRTLENLKQQIMAKSENFLRQKQIWQETIDDLEGKYLKKQQDWERKILFLEQEYMNRRQNYEDKQKQENKILDNLIEQKNILEKELEELNQSLLEKKEIQQNSDLRLNRLLADQSSSSQLIVEREEVVGEKNIEEIYFESCETIGQQCNNEQHILSEPVFQPMLELVENAVNPKSLIPLVDMNFSHFIERDEKHTPFSQWLGELLVTQIPLKPQADGRPLYAYEVSDKEYQKLMGLFHKQGKITGENQYRYHEWAACYCLAISEIYRREYDGGDWNWDFFDKKLLTQFTNQQKRYDTIKTGLQFWRRSVQQQNNRNNYLGTLFFEGGLPVNLLSTINSSFGKIIAYGLEKYGDSLRTFKPLEEYIAEKQNSLAQPFQNEGTKELFVNTVCALMDLAQRFNLKEQKLNPAEYLDRVADDDWRRSFPFVLPRVKADELINYWLGHAVQEQVKENTNYFSCIHYIYEDNFQLFASLSLPEYYQFKVSEYSGRTFLQWRVFEGNHPVPTVGGNVFASLNGNQLGFKLPKDCIDFKRKYPNQILSVRFFVDSLLLYTEWLPNSSFNEEGPLIFKKQIDKKWQLFANSEYTHINSPYLICLPPGFTLLENNIQIKYEDNKGRCWLTATDSLIAKYSDEREIQVVYSEHLAMQVLLHGEIFLNHFDIDGLPIYRGFPKLNTPADLACTHVRINGQEYKNQLDDLYGTFRVDFYHENICLIRRNISVLPYDFKYFWKSAHDKAPAELYIHSQARLVVKVHSHDVKVIEKSENIFILIVSDSTVNNDITLQIGSGDAAAAVRLSLPIPYLGAYIRDENGVLANTKLLVNDLLGKRIMISSPKSQYIYLDYHLKCEKIKRSKQLQLNSEQSGMELELYLWKDEFLQLLSCSKDCNDQLELVIHVGGKDLLKLIIAHYNGHLIWNNEIISHGNILGESSKKCDSFSIREELSDGYPSLRAKVKMMRLDKLDTQAQVLLPNSFLDKGNYDLPTEIHDDNGIWLIYPAAESPVQFRPRVFIDDNNRFIECMQHHSLSIAIRYFHLNQNPDAISHIIAEMALQPEHEGWQYLDVLRQQVTHLPLSNFEVWKELARQPQALALAVLVLRLDSLFCERIRWELSVIWEWLHEDIWCQAAKKYDDYMNTKLADMGCSSNLSAKNIIPSNVLFKCDVLIRYILKGFLSKEEDNIINNKINDIFLSKCRHASFYNLGYNHIISQNETLPDTLSNTLERWLNQLPKKEAKKFIELSKSKRDRAVVWLPVFTAYMKAGKAQPKDIYDEQHHVACFIDEFYKVYYLNPEWFDETCAVLTSYLMGEN